MAMQDTKKAVLIVTGAWHVPEHYRLVVKRLEDAGVRTICPCLPTNNNSIPPNRTLNDDIQFIHDMVEKEVASGTQLTVLAHSYGGIISTAVMGKFSISSKDSQTERGGVASIIYMAAFIPAEGQSLAGMFGGQLPPYLTPSPDKTTLIWTEPIDHLYNDLPKEEAEAAEALRVAHPYEAQHSGIATDTPAAWRIIPVNYLLCEGDCALPGFVQEMMIETVEKEGIDVNVFRCHAGHSPFLSQPDRVAEVIQEVLKTY